LKILSLTIKPYNINEKEIGQVFSFLKLILIGKRYENEKKLRGNATGNNQYKKEECSESYDKPKGRTCDILAKEYGIGSKTVEDNEKFAKGLDVLPESGDDENRLHQKPKPIFSSI
jgi:hypothetical protein